MNCMEASVLFFYKKGYLQIFIKIILIDLVVAIGF